jgi:hypothetical protein
MNTHHKHDHHDNTTSDHTINKRSTPSAPEHEINSPPTNRTTTQRSQNEDQKIKIQDPKSAADPCITIRRGVRADARRHKPTPRGDLGTVGVDLVRGW